MIKHSSTLHDQFQFAWTNDLELLSNIGKRIISSSIIFSYFEIVLAVWTVEDPLIFLYDSNQRKYGIYPLSTKLNENIEIETILNEIVSNYSEIIQHTGNNWKKRLLRPFLEFYRTIIAMFAEAPLLSLLVIGLPSALLSIICYCLCCLPNETLLDEREIREIDANEPEEEEEEPEEKTTIEKKDD